MRGRWAAAGAVALGILLAWLLLRGEAGPTGPETSESAPPRREAARATAPRLDSSPEPTTLAKVPAASPPGKPQAFSLDLVAANEEGSPVKGISFLAMVRGEDGDPEPSLEPEALFKEETDAEGKCTLHWKERPEEVLLLAICRTDEVVAVEGGSFLGPGTSGESVSAAPGTGTLRLTMRTRAGVGSLFLIDARTGEPITFLHWKWRVRLPDGSIATSRNGAHGAEAVRIPLQLPDLPRRNPGASDERVLEFAAQGFETAEIRLGEFRGATPLRLEPKRPSVVGEIVVPGWREDRGSLDLGLSATLVKEEAPTPPEEGQSPPLGWPPVAPRRPGPFALYDLAEGKWELRLMVITREGPRWACRAFEVAGGTVDLGTLEISGWSGVRVRLLDSEGRPVTTAGFSVAHLGRSPMVFFGPVKFIDQGGNAFFEVQGRIATNDPGLDPDGWYLFPSLAPGVQHRISATSATGVSAEVTTPETNGAVIDVELRLPEKAPEKEAAAGDFALPVEEE